MDKEILIYFAKKEQNKLTATTNMNLMKFINTMFSKTGKTLKNTNGVVP